MRFWKRDVQRLLIHIADVDRDRFLEDIAPFVGHLDHNFMASGRLKVQVCILRHADFTRISVDREPTVCIVSQRELVALPSINIGHLHATDQSPPRSIFRYDRFRKRDVQRHLIYVVDIDIEGFLQHITTLVSHFDGNLMVGSGFEVQVCILRHADLARIGVDGKSATCVVGEFVLVTVASIDIGDLDLGDRLRIRDDSTSRPCSNAHKQRDE